MSETYTIERFSDRPSWLHGRHGSLGASEASAPIGLNSYQSGYGLWVHKTEPIRIEPMDEIAEWGLILEPVILSEFSKRAKVTICRDNGFVIYRSTERPHLHFSPDAMTGDGQPVQAKTAHFAAGKIWQKEVPLGYVCGLQQEIYISGADCGFIAVLIDGYGFRWHRVPRHQKFIDRLLKRLDHFWNEHVVKRQPPPTDYHSATTAALARKYPASNGTAVELPADLEPLYAEYDTLTKQESAAKKRKAEISNLLKERIGDHEYGSFGGNEGFKWAGKDGGRRFTRTARCPEPVSGH